MRTYRIAVLVMAMVACMGLARAGEIIGLALPTQQEERWTRDLAAMQEEAKARGIDLRVQIARNDQMQQNNQIDNLLSQGILSPPTIAKLRAWR